jgi:hypothetical protein
MTKVSKLALAGLVAAVAGCSDVVAPPGPVQDASPAFGGGVTTALSGVDTTQFSITIDPWRSTSYNLGEGNTLTFPAGSVCDPTKSTYGTGEWDKPCSASRSSVTVHVKAWLDAQGHPRVDFTPNLRFVPSLLPTGWVQLTFGDYAASLDPFYNILYCRNENAACIDESKTDPSLLTVRNPVTGKVTRRIKHFSGYNVGAGDDVPPSDLNKVGTGLKLAPQAPAAPAEPSVKTASNTTAHRSGYILVSGD